MDGDRTVDGSTSDLTPLRPNTPDRNVELTIDLGREHRISLVALYFHGCCEYNMCWCLSKFVYVKDGHGADRQLHNHHLFAI